MARSKPSPLPNGPECRFVTIVGSGPYNLFGLTKAGRVYTFVQDGWKPVSMKRWKEKV